MSHKIIKYMISVLLIMMAFTVISEFYGAYVYGFEEQYTYVTFDVPEEDEYGEMLTDIQSAAEENDVSVFAVNRKHESGMEDIVNIYAMPEASEILKKNLDEGIIRSMFWGEFEVNFYDFAKVSEVPGISEFRLTGEMEDAQHFKGQLTDRYGGAFPRAGYEGFDSVMSVEILWGLVYLFLILLTLYEVAVRKKEMVIRIVSGQSIEGFVRRNIVQDSAVYILIFTAGACITGVTANGEYHIGLSVLMLTGFLILNGLAYIWLLFVNYRRDVAGKSSLKLVLKVSYVYKAVAMMMVVLLLSANMGIVYEGLEYMGQRDFFEKYSDYDVVSLGIMSDVDNEKKNEDMEKNADDLVRSKIRTDDAFVLYQVGYEPGNDNYIWAAGSVLDYLQEEIPELKQTVLEKKVYVIEPEDYRKSRNADDSSMDMLLYTGKSANEYEIIKYISDAHIISMSKDSVGVLSKTNRNPVIILDNTGNMQFDTCWFNAAINLTEDEWNDFVGDNQLENEVAYRTNLYDQYISQWQIMKKGMCISIVLFALLLCMEILITSQLVGYEYKVNAKELTLERVLGYSFWRRYAKILKVSIIVSIFGLFISLCLCFVMKLDLYSYIIFGTVILVLIESAVTVAYIRRMEAVSISKILKGGIL